MSMKVVIIIAAAFLLIMGMMGAGFFFMYQKMNQTVAQVQNQNSEKAEEEAAAAAAEEANKMGPIFRMDTMIVNLADQGGKRYLRITMEFEISSEELIPEIEKRMPQIRDAILMILPTKQYADIGTTEGKIQLRDELMANLNMLLKTGSIVTIYFSEFVVQ